MIQTIEAIVDEAGRVQLLGQFQVSGARRALVTILEEPPATNNEATLLSEAALGVDWNRAEEDEAWSHLQLEK